MLKYKVKTSKGITLITLEGNVMGGPDASALNEELHTLLEQKQVKVIIDLGGVTLINSTGLGILINGLTLLRNAGGELKLACPSSKILHLLEITKLHKVFDIHKTVQSALKAFE